jgi:hypothetical protein
MYEQAYIHTDASVFDVCCIFGVGVDIFILLLFFFSLMGNQTALIPPRCCGSRIILRCIQKRERWADGGEDRALLMPWYLDAYKINTLLCNDIGTIYEYITEYED